MGNPFSGKQRTTLPRRSLNPYRGSLSLLVNDHRFPNHHHLTGVSNYRYSFEYRFSTETHTSSFDQQHLPPFLTHDQSILTHPPALSTMCKSRVFRFTICGHTKRIRWTVCPTAKETGMRGTYCEFKSEGPLNEVEDNKGCERCQEFVMALKKRGSVASGASEDDVDEEVLVRYGWKKRGHHF